MDKKCTKKLKIIFVSTYAGYRNAIVVPGSDKDKVHGECLVVCTFYSISANQLEGYNTLGHVERMIFKCKVAGLICERKYCFIICGCNSACI